MDITTKDLNAVDRMNGQADGSTISSVIVTPTGEGLKGALAKYNGSFSQYNELQFLMGAKKQIEEYEIERFSYTGLPTGLDKYRFENKIIQNGSAALVLFGGTYYMCSYTIETFNMYDEPRMIRIIEPKSTILNDRVFDVALDNAIIIRNNIKKMSNYQIAYRYISAMEKVLYQIEKNITAGAPKGLINLKGAEFDSDGDNPLQDSMERVINGQNTFYVIKSKSLGSSDLADDNGESLFTPIEFTDRTENLLKQYTFMKEQIKEIIGAISNQMQGKKERLITSEVDTQQPLANATRQHSFNIRQIDIDKINEKFKTNIQIEYQSDDREDEEEEDDENNQNIKTKDKD